MKLSIRQLRHILSVIKWKKSWFPLNLFLIVCTKLWLSETGLISNEFCMSFNLRVGYTHLGTYHLISGGGGARVFVACKLFFFTSGGKQAFFLAINVQHFLSYAFPIMYVTIWCFFWSAYFSSISRTNFFFCPHFQQTFFGMLW